MANSKMTKEDQESGVEHVYQFYLQFARNPEWNRDYENEVIAWLRRNGRDVPFIED